ncbi:MAG: SDR family oxidoreductase [Acidobacteria bacterium]|nr:SDR family oxidoreductase [Acidobacteriota bacterium]
MRSTHAFAEKVALVAGVSGPIGRAVALQLALLGAFVVSVDDESSAESDRSLDELRSLGTLAGSVTADLATQTGAEFAVAEIDKMFGRIDLLVVCLKLDDESEFLKFDGPALENMLGAAVKTPCFLIQEAFRLMNPRPKARIVNVVPPIGDRTNAVLYQTARAAVEGLTRTMAAALPKHFRVNCVAVEGVRGLKKNDLFVEETGITNDDVARTVLFLLSSEAAGVNGRTISVG